MSEFVEVEYEIPEDAVDGGYVLYYQYFDMEGEKYVGAVSSEELSYSDVLGMTEAGKLRVAYQALRDLENDE